MEPAWPRNSPGYAVSVNLATIWDWIRGRNRKKLRQWLADARKRRRQNLHYKEKPITEAELYDMAPCGRRAGCASCPDRDECPFVS